jgi:AcrR family transcriptional regulator
MTTKTHGKAQQPSAQRRLAPKQRRAEILQAALGLLAREGLEGFSLEAAAREAGVAASLPRHYFGGVSELLKVATRDVLREVEQLLLSRDVTPKLEERIPMYLEVLARHPWAHEVWMTASEHHAEIRTLVRRARCRMAEYVYATPWAELSVREQYEARGRIGHIEAVVAEWLERKTRDRAIVVDTLLAVMRNWTLEARQGRAAGSPNVSAVVAPVAA